MVWGFCFVLFCFFEKILTFHITARNCKERTAGAQSHETKERRQKRRKNSKAETGFFLFFLFLREGEKDFVFHNREHYDNVATHNENLVFY